MNWFFLSYVALALLSAFAGFALGNDHLLLGFAAGFVVVAMMQFAKDNL